MRFYDSALIGVALWSNLVLVRFLKYYIHLFPFTSDIDIDIDNSRTLSLSSLLTVSSYTDQSPVG